MDVVIFNHNQSSDVQQKPNQVTTTYKKLHGKNTITLKWLYLLQKIVTELDLSMCPNRVVIVCRIGRNSHLAWAKWLLIKWVITQVYMELGVQWSLILKELKMRCGTSWLFWLTLQWQIFHAFGTIY